MTDTPQDVTPSWADEIAALDRQAADIEARRRDVRNRLMQDSARALAVLPDYKSVSVTVGHVRMAAGRHLDDAARRLRTALGGESADGSPPLPVALVLYAGPTAEDLHALSEIGLVRDARLGKSVGFCLFVGDARPEELARFVRRYGGDCRGRPAGRRARKRPPPDDR